MTPTQQAIRCQQTRNNWEQYEVGGSQYENTNAITRSGEINKWKKKYSDEGCGKDILMEKCLERENYINQIRETISVKTQQGNLNYTDAMSKVLFEEKNKFSKLGCEKKIEQSRQVAVADTVNKYSELDKQRIEADSKYQVKVRVFMGASIFLIGLTVMIILKRKA